MPFAAVAVSVPWSAAVPVAPRAALITVELSELNVLPNWSATRTTGWVTRAIPAVAVVDGCVATSSLLAAVAATVTLSLSPGWLVVIDPLSITPTRAVSALKSASVRGVAMPFEKLIDCESPNVLPARVGEVIGAGELLAPEKVSVCDPV